MLFPKLVTSQTIFNLDFEPQVTKESPTRPPTESTLPNWGHQLGHFESVGDSLVTRSYKSNLAMFELLFDSWQFHIFLSAETILSWSEKPRSPSSLLVVLLLRCVLATPQSTSDLPILFLTLVPSPQSSLLLTTPRRTLIELRLL